MNTSRITIEVNDDGVWPKISVLESNQPGGRYSVFSVKGFNDKQRMNAGKFFGGFFASDNYDCTMQCDDRKFIMTLEEE